MLESSHARDASYGSTRRWPRSRSEAAQHSWKRPSTSRSPRCSQRPGLGARAHGTIGLLMDCDTTVSSRTWTGEVQELVVAATWRSSTRRCAGMRKLGTPRSSPWHRGYIDENKSIVGAPGLHPRPPVFACSMGDNTSTTRSREDDGCVQPSFGAISKTVNMPEDATIEDVANLHMDAWKIGREGRRIYRDNCKVGQPLSTRRRTASPPRRSPDRLGRGERSSHRATQLELEVARSESHKSRSSLRSACRAGASRQFAFVSRTAKATSRSVSTRTSTGEVFIKVSKQGSTLAGIMDAFSISISSACNTACVGDVRAQVRNMKFEPSGMTTTRSAIATSLWTTSSALGVGLLKSGRSEELGVLSTSEAFSPRCPRSRAGDASHSAAADTRRREREPTNSRSSESDQQVTADVLQSVSHAARGCASVLDCGGRRFS